MRELPPLLLGETDCIEWYLFLLLLRRGKKSTRHEFKRNDEKLKDSQVAATLQSSFSQKKKNNKILE